MNGWARRKAVFAAVALIAVAIFGVGGWGFYRRLYPVYPFGWSHCCDRQLMMALLQYADRHGGWFPKGEASPEASLALLERVFARGWGKRVRGALRAAGVLRRKQL